MICLYTVYVLIIALSITVYTFVSVFEFYSKGFICFHH